MQSAKCHEVLLDGTPVLGMHGKVIAGIVMLAYLKLLGGSNSSSPGGRASDVVDM